MKNAAQILLESDDDITNDEIDNILGLSGIDDGLREVSILKKNSYYLLIRRNLTGSLEYDKK